MARKSAPPGDDKPSGPSSAPPSPAGPVIVAVAASAAAYGSLERLFAQVSGKDHLVWVVTLKQDDGLPTDQLVEALARLSGLPAEAVADGGTWEADHIYIGPTDQLLTLEGDRFKLAPLEQPAGHRGAVDSLLISLAQVAQAHAVGVVLTGLGSDGSAGVRALKEQGGLTIAEFDETRPSVAAHTHDPVSLVDSVLPAEKIPAHIAAYADHLQQLAQGQIAAALKSDAAQTIARIAAVLRAKTGHDFHGYKQNTFLRRIQRRMQVRQIGDIQIYLEFLRSDGEEVEHLFQDLLIGVTQFFRDGPEFDLLRREVIPRLFAGKDAHDPVRVWVLGCATGEEAYSIGILLREHMATLDAPPPVQIFATDIDGRALTMARAGRYPESIAKDVAPERLTRWFAKEGTTYSVVKELREMCIFSQHNVVRDAPFSRIDLISCRNLLIYLTSELQDRVIPLFHFSLRPSGYLFLGPSENITRNAKLFSPLDRRHRIFRRAETATRVLPDFPLTVGDRARSEPERATSRRARNEAGLGRRAERIAERYAPAYVLIDEHFEVLNFSGGTGRFLEPAAGAANLSLLNLVHRDLRLDLRAALHTAASERIVAKAERLQVGVGGEARRVDLIVEPIFGPDTPTSFVVLFRDGGPAPTNDEQDRPDASVLRDEQVQQLDAELRLIKERLQSTIEELESTNEELKSSNEEYQSINEELQSANEELETSKEELQSVNEELQTVNGELANRVADLARANSDLKNLLESTQIATVFLDNDLRIKSFTPSVADIFHLIESDLGRPITHIAGRIAYPDLQEDVKKVLRTLAVVEREVGDPASGARFLVRVLPYRSIDNFIAGVVITFLDITAAVRAQADVEAAGQQTRDILESIRDAFCALDGEFRFTYVNQRALEQWDKTADQVLGRRLTDVFPTVEGSETYGAMRRAAAEAVPIHIEALSPIIHQWLALSVYPAASGGVSVYFRDISERKRSEERQSLLMAELQHRVKNILAVVRSITGRTLEGSGDLAEFGAHFDGRLGALARTQSVMARQGDGEIDLEEIVREELLSHAAHEGEQTEISGPSIRLRRKAAETLSLALHELATNAVKYGALASPSGRVSVAWRTLGGPAGPRLSLEWRESGVPLIDPNPARIGFGRDLIERGLPYDLGAATALEFSPGGVRCVIEIPLNERVASPASYGSKSARREGSKP